MGRSKKIVLQVLILAVLAGMGVSFADPSRPRLPDGGFASPVPFSLSKLLLY